MQVGTRPEAAIGVYTGKFYLDPTCVAVMPQSVLGYHTEVEINGVTNETEHSLVLAAGGLLTMKVTGGTLYFGATDLADSTQLTAYPARDLSFVTSINGIPVPADGKLLIRCTDSRIISTSQQLQPSGGVILDLDGTTAYPNCYNSVLDHAVPQ